MQVTIFKLMEGIELILQVVEETDDYYICKDVGNFRLVSQNELGVAPWSMFSEPSEPIKIFKRAVSAEIKPSQQIKNEYERAFGKLMTPPDASQKIII